IPRCVCWNGLRRDAGAKHEIVAGVADRFASPCGCRVRNRRVQRNQDARELICTGSLGKYGKQGGWHGGTSNSRGSRQTTSCHSAKRECNTRRRESFTIPFETIFKRRTRENASIFWKDLRCKKGR